MVTKISLKTTAALALTVATVAEAAPTNFAYIGTKGAPGASSTGNADALPKPNAPVAPVAAEGFSTEGVAVSDEPVSYLEEDWQNSFSLQIPKDYSEEKLWGYTDDWGMNLENPSKHAACRCPGDTKVYSDGLCYSSLKEIVEKGTGKTIYIGSDLWIDEEIIIGQNELNLYGVDCASSISNGEENAFKFRKPVITSAVCGTENALGVHDKKVGVFRFQPYDAGDRTTFNWDEVFRQRFNMRDLEVTQIEWKGENEENGECFGQFLYVPEHHKSFAGSAGLHEADINVRHCKFSKFMGRSEGVIIDISVVNHMYIDDNTVVRDNHMKGFTPNNYMAGMVHINQMWSPGNAFIGGLWINNKVEFPFVWNVDGALTRKGSVHAEGGCIYLFYLEGSLALKGTFVGNSANEGGVMSIKEIRNWAKVNIDGLYQDNWSREEGGQTRGGCFRFFSVSGQVKLRGIYRNNKSTYPGSSDPFSGRGAVLAVNYMNSRASEVDIAGKFENNESKDWGSIFSVQGLKKSGGNIRGTIRIRGNESTFKGNKAENARNLDIIWINKHKNLKNINDSIKKGKNFVVKK